MKRNPFRRPEGADLERALARQRDNRAASVQRSREKQRQKPPKERKPRKPVRPVNPERKVKLFRRQFHSEAFVAWVHSLGCSVPACGATDIEAAHARGVGAGGTWEDILPLCHRHHALSHTLGIQTFERRVGFRLADVAASVHQRWLQFAGSDES